jgi:predicted small metal-binding protein
MAYRVDCTQGDEFMIQSEDESEVIEHVKQHAKEKHDMDLGDDEARGMIQGTT